MQKNDCNLIANSLFKEEQLIAKLGVPTYRNTKTITFSLIPRIYPIIKVPVTNEGGVING